MTRKKSKLWLNEPKREALAKGGNLVTTHTYKTAIFKKRKAIKGNLIHETQRQNRSEFFHLI